MIAAALGRLSDPTSIEPLIRLAGDEKRSLHVRAMGVVALGLICEPEPLPSRVRLTAGANYPARTASMEQLFNIL